MNADLFNGLSLAYIGDAVYELHIRKSIMELGYSKVDTLHKKVVSFTNGNYQALVIRDLLANNLLNEQEISAYKHGRNSHINTKRKNMDLAVYLDATGFEALLGYLYLKEDLERLNFLLDYSLKLK